MGNRLFNAFKEVGVFSREDGWQESRQAGKLLLYRYDGIKAVHCMIGFGDPVQQMFGLPVKDLASQRTGMMHLVAGYQAKCQKIVGP